MTNTFAFRHLLPITLGLLLSSGIVLYGNTADTNAHAGQIINKTHVDNVWQITISGNNLTETYPIPQSKWVEAKLGDIAKIKDNHVTFYNN